MYASRTRSRGGIAALFGAGIMSLAVLTGCRTAYYESFRAPSTKGAPTGTDKILGWPLQIAGDALKGDQASAAARDVESVLARKLGDRLVPAATILGQNSPPIKEVEAAMKYCTAFSFHLESRKKALADLAKATGCRYLLLPAYATHDVTTRSEYHVAYAIPVGYIIVYGNVPIAMGSQRVDRMPVYTATVFDMTTGEIVRGDVYADKKEASVFDIKCLDIIIARLKL